MMTGRMRCMKRGVMVVVAVFVVLAAVMPMVYSAAMADDEQSRLYPIRVGGKYGLINSAGIVLTPTVLKNVYRSTEGLSAAQSAETEKWGYIDGSGTFVIPPQFKHAYRFREGLAAVRWSENHAGYIDTTGREVITLAPNQALGLDTEFRHGLAVVRERLPAGESVAVFIDRSGQVVIRTAGNEAWNTDGDLLAFFVRGTRTVGFMDRNGTVVIEPIYRITGYRTPNVFSEPIQAVCTAISATENTCGFIDKQGNVVGGFAFSWTEEFSEGMAVVGKDGLYGYADPTGTVVIQPQYEQAEKFSDGLAAVKVSGGLWGFIDKTGRMVIEPQYYGLKWGGPIQFHEGLAAVVFDKMFSTGYIDKRGNVVVPPVLASSNEFSGGIAEIVPLKSSGLSYGYINKQGEYVWTETSQLESSAMIIKPPATLHFTGTVKYIDLEGGFWGIVADDGKHYDPINLAKDYQQEGLRVVVDAVVTNRIGIHMWGTIVEIKAITNTVDHQSATQWAYIGTGNNPKMLGYFYEYIDKNTVTQQGDSITYWILERYYDEADGILDQKSLRKIEAIASTLWQRRQVEAYYYGVSGREEFHDTAPGDFRRIKLPLHEQEITVALQYARDGHDTELKPALPEELVKSSN